ncbi:MAG: hypothetical protein ACOY45_16660 [Pseudomonadota bacterium]
MEILRKQAMKGLDGSSQQLTGRVTVMGNIQHRAPPNLTGAIVHFETARAAARKHSRGRMLIVAEGVGWTQMEGGEAPESIPPTSRCARPASANGTARTRWKGGRISRCVHHTTDKPCSGWRKGSERTIRPNRRATEHRAPAPKAAARGTVRAGNSKPRQPAGMAGF